MIACPHCAYAIELKGVRAGQFQPKCPRCQAKFALIISADAAVVPLVSKLDATDHTHAGVARPTAAAAAAATQPPHVMASVAAAGVGTLPPQSPVRTPPDMTAAPGPSRPTVTESMHAATPPAAVERVSTPVAPGPATSETAVVDIAPGATLGGYVVSEKLGAGGMGAVYLARQVSLDRNVALKTLHPKLADDPQLVARFTREAYAAAQLTHHNIVQIYDIGAENGINFFSMEFVQGRTLADVLRESHKLDVETGVGYALQAARGLKFAHEHGLVHRDVKPENLLLNDQGVVKVADLGLVKRVGTDDVASASAPQAAGDLATTQHNKSMGTPLYMPPEQATDAARVDHRADIYSLGCTLYHLITGQPPFTGRTAMEVITKHKSAPIIPPDVVVDDVPQSLSPVILRMLAKRPEGRFVAMKDVIDSLEGFLGIASAGPYTASSEQIKILEFAAQQYNASPFTRLRPQVVTAFYAACGLLAVLLAYVNRDDVVTATNFVGGMIGLAVLTTVAYLVTAGVLQKQYLFLKMRQLVFGAGVLDWLTWIGGVAVFGVLVYAFGLWVPWLVAAVGGVIIAQAFYWTFDVAAAKAREHSLQQAEGLIKTLRMRGLDENAIRQFVCRFAGRHWEAFYEALFGYEDKLQARKVWGKERGKDRPKFAAWREPVLAYIHRRIEARKRAREERILAKVEQKAMQAKGIDARMAARQAGKNAERLVENASKMKHASGRHVAATMVSPPSAKETAVTAPPPSKLPTAFGAAMTADVPHDVHDVDDHLEGYERQSFTRRRFGTPLEFVTSGFVRGLVGLLLLAVFAQWWTGNSSAKLIAEGQRVLTITRESELKLAAQKSVNAAGIVAQRGLSTLNDRTPLRLPLVPTRWTEPLDPRSFLAAGLMLLVGAVFRGKLFGLLMYAAAGFTLVGYLTGIPAISGQFMYGLLVGITLWAFAVIFVRAKHD